MADKVEIRTLYPEEIEIKVQQVTEKGACFILYKDSRVDMSILDETFGPLGWKNEHFMLDGKTFCTISLWDEQKNEWITKSNVGFLDSNNGAGGSAKVKGEISDSFKRAATVVGIGRELYTAPFIWIGAQYLNIFKKNNGGYGCNSKLRVSMIEYDEKRRISKLEIVDDKNGGRAVYRYQKPVAQAAKQQPAQQSQQSQTQQSQQPVQQNQAPVQQQRPVQQQNQQPAQNPVSQNQTAPAQNQQAAPQSNPVQQTQQAPAVKNTQAQPQAQAPANTVNNANAGNGNVNQVQKAPAGIQVTDSATNQQQSPGDFILDVGWAKGQTISQYWQNSVKRAMQKEGKVDKDKIFQFYLSLNEERFDPLKAAVRAFMATV